MLLQNRKGRNAVAKPSCGWWLSSHLNQRTTFLLPTSHTETTLHCFSVEHILLRAWHVLAQHFLLGTTVFQPYAYCEQIKGDLHSVHEQLFHLCGRTGLRWRACHHSGLLICGLCVSVVRLEGTAFEKHAQALMWPTPQTNTHTTSISALWIWLNEQLWLKEHSHTSD